VGRREVAVAKGREAISFGSLQSVLSPQARDQANVLRHKRAYRHHRRAVCDPQLSGDGLVNAHAAGTQVFVRDRRLGAANVLEHRRQVQHIRLSPNGLFLLVVEQGEQDKSHVCLHNLESKETRRSMHDAPLIGIDLSDDAAWVVLAGQHEVKVFSGTNMEEHVHRSEHLENQVCSLSLSNDGTTAAVACQMLNPAGRPDRGKVTVFQTCTSRAWGGLVAKVRRVLSQCNK
jgi:hypothetical protein